MTQGRCVAPPLTRAVSIQGRELWLPIPGWRHYEVSSHGRVRSVDRVIKYRNRRYKGKVLKPVGGTMWNRATSVSLYDADESRRKIFKIAFLVLVAFVGPRPHGRMVCHNDDVQTHNALNNLYWGTSKDNSVDRVKNGRTNKGKKVLRKPRMLIQKEA